MSGTRRCALRAISAATLHSCGASEARRGAGERDAAAPCCRGIALGWQHPTRHPARPRLPLRPALVAPAHPPPAPAQAQAPARTCTPCRICWRLTMSTWAHEINMTGCEPIHKVHFERQDRCNGSTGPTRQLPGSSSSPTAPDPGRWTAAQPRPHHGSARCGPEGAVVPPEVAYHVHGRQGCGGGGRGRNDSRLGGWVTEHARRTRAACGSSQPGAAAAKSSPPQPRTQHSVTSLPAARRPEARCRPCAGLSDPLDHPPCLLSLPSPWLAPPSRPPTHPRRCVAGRAPGRAPCPRR
jgi:hypothetical protein